MVTETAENLCKSVGRVIHSNDRSEIECGDFMRIRVEVDVHRPLCRGRRVRFNPDREVGCRFGINSYRFFVTGVGF